PSACTPLTSELLGRHTECCCPYMTTMRHSAPSVFRGKMTSASGIIKQIPTSSFLAQYRRTVCFRQPSLESILCTDEHLQEGKFLGVSGMLRREKAIVWA